MICGTSQRLDRDRAGQLVDVWHGRLQLAQVAAGGEHPHIGLQVLDPPGVVDGPGRCREPPGPLQVLRFETGAELSARTSTRSCASLSPTACQAAIMTGSGIMSTFGR